MQHGFVALDQRPSSTRVPATTSLDSPTDSAGVDRERRRRSRTQSARSCPRSRAPVPAARRAATRSPRRSTTPTTSIAALERLIAKKQAIKQGMMQQLLTGRTRLPGFTEPMERGRRSVTVASRRSTQARRRRRRRHSAVVNYMDVDRQDIDRWTQPIGTSSRIRRSDQRCSCRARRRRLRTTLGDARRVGTCSRSDVDHATAICQLRHRCVVDQVGCFDAIICATAFRLDAPIEAAVCAAAADTLRAQPSRRLASCRVPLPPTSTSSERSRACSAMPTRDRRALSARLAKARAIKTGHDAGAAHRPHSPAGRGGRRHERRRPDRAQGAGPRRQAVPGAARLRLPRQLGVPRGQLQHRGRAARRRTSRPAATTTT